VTEHAADPPKEVEDLMQNSGRFKNDRRADGSVVISDVLRPCMRGAEVIEPRRPRVAHRSIAPTGHRPFVAWVSGV
jgi:hypothetical protein